MMRYDNSLSRSVEGNNLLEGLPLQYLYENKSDWNIVLDKIRVYDIKYTINTIDYQRIYFTEKDDCYCDYSIIYYVNHEPVGIWPLCVYQRNGVYQVGTNGTICTYPRIADSLYNSKAHKKMAEYCMRFLERLCLLYGIDHADIALNTFLYPLDVFYEKLLSANGIITYHCHDLYVNLQNGIRPIWANMRKSYKSLINNGKNHVLYEIVDGTDRRLNQAFAEFRDLHIQVSGRVTRNEQTWDTLKIGLRHSEGFIILNRNTHSDLIGATLISTTPSTACYSIGAYDRALFHTHALGHLNQILAIERLCELGKEWYNIGIFPQRADNPAPTEKEITIGNFKKGFATDVAIVNKLTIQMDENICNF